MKKQPEITEKTKRSLAAAFCTLYTQKPIDKITIKEITTLSGYNRSTFYQYFNDVYDLLDYIENDLLNAIMTTWKENGDSLFNPNLRYLLVLFQDKEHYLKAVLGDFGYVHFFTRLKEKLPLNEISASFSQTGNLVPYLAEFHMATSLSLFRVWLKREKDLSENELVALIHNLYTKGISYLTE